MAVQLRDEEFFGQDDSWWSVMCHNSEKFATLPADFSGWASLPALLHLRVWLFTEPWPLVMCLRKVCKKWNSLVTHFKPYEPTPQVAYTTGIWRDFQDKEECRKRARAEKVRATARAAARVTAKKKQKKERVRASGGYVSRSSSSSPPQRPRIGRPALSWYELNDCLDYHDCQDY